ncbi:Microbial collagenase precursor [Actinomadura rubteroloni]|uniref:Microbial collagenase n=1 Tax=Actinomadura rubteroloni TaxID=1926885 RepID=A0A2P4UQ08_9ACTN|nr:PKD domain-containing protein [Actinomadura rubteroloni]POM27130.1 Microbial collagenase precursor [Actinomadura rubteroloni]
MVRTCRALFALVLVLAGAVGLAGAASAERLPQDVLANPDPVNWTPNILDGTVYAIEQIGGKVIVGGSFTQVKEVGNSTAFNRANILAFDATTGKIDTSFVPKIDKPVYELQKAPDGKTVYVGGAFNTVNGAALKGVARLNASNGSTVTTFKPPLLDGIVRHIGLTHGHLIVGGTFATVGTADRAGLASLDPDTGEADTYVDLGISGLHNGGTTKVWEFAISPDQTKLAVIGNFTRVGTQVRDQFAMLNLTDDGATVANYYTKAFEAKCSSSVETYLRDVEFSPDGAYFAIGATGAYYANTLCDSVSRWETNQSGTDVKPTWINYTGGDTITAVAPTGPVIYVGGHNRWLNNPFCADAACQGAVSRPGISAIDPVNGLPLDWNPTRDRGHAVEDIVPTDDGVWIGSDTDQVNGEYHAKIAKFPLAGGREIPKNNIGKLPADVYAVGGVQIFNPDNNIDKRAFDGTTVGGTTSVPTGGTEWSKARGAFMINGQLYYGASSGKFYRRTFDGTNYGSPVEINTADQLANMTTWHNEVDDITGSFFVNGRVYYTRSAFGATGKLFYRYFEPDSDIVGGEVYTATGNITGLDWSDVQGMFYANGKIYWASKSNGNLKSVTFTNGQPVAGTVQTVDTKNDWRARALFVLAGKANVAPKAAFTTSCQARACTFDGGSSADTDGTVASYAWDFGDGKTATGESPQHTYADTGTYTVKLTVTDNDGDTGSTTKTVQVVDDTVTYRGGDGYNGNSKSPSVNVPSGVAPGDGMLLLLTSNSSTVTVATPPAGWTKVSEATSSGVTSTVWRRVAAAGDAGAAVTVGLSDYAKVDLRLLAYRSTSPTNPVTAAVSKIDGTAATTHVTPKADVASTGSLVVSYWSDKGTTTEWTAPDGLVERGHSGGGTSSSISTLVADSGGIVPVGSYGGFAATANASANKAVMWTIVLR